MDQSLVSNNLADQTTQIPKKVVIVRTDVKRSDYPSEQAYIAEAECITRSQQIADIIQTLGIQTAIVPANSDLTNQLTAIKPDLCFNFVDTLQGSAAMASGFPAIFNLLHIPFLGSDTLGISLSNNKYLSKTLLEAWEIPTPQYQLLRSSNQELEYEMRYPLIVKLNEEHGSVGIDAASVVTNDRELKSRVKYLIDTYQQPVLVEEFIENGREFTALVVETSKMNVILAERIYQTPNQQGFKLLTFDTKWATDLGKEEPVTYQPITDVDPHILKVIKNDIRIAFEILRIDDFGRFDIMLDKFNNHYLIDCNANPALGPDSSFARAAQANQISFVSLLRKLLMRYLNTGDFVKPPDFSARVLS